MGGPLNGNTNPLVKWAVGLVLASVAMLAMYTVSNVVSDIKMLKDHDTQNQIARAVTDGRYADILERLNNIDDRLAGAPTNRQPPRRMSAVKAHSSSTAVAKSRDDTLNGM